MVRSKSPLHLIDRRHFLTAAALASAAAIIPRTARALERRARVLTRDSVELYVKDWGSGRPVILTHAWPLNADSWDHHAVALTEAGYRVIAYDRRGFGRSSQPSDGYDYDTFADDLRDVIKATGVKDVTLIGYSMGGGEIVRYLSRHGGKRVAKIGLVGSVVPGIVKSADNPNGVDSAVFSGIKDGLRKDRAGFLAGLLKNVFYDTSIAGTHPVTPEVLDWSMYQAMQASLRALIGCVDAFGGESWRPELSALNVPALILHGTADKPVPFELTAKVAATGIRQAKLVAYAGTSHGLLVTERERVTRDLLEFLRS
jgi:non-heme chloroperoxidase